MAENAVQIDLSLQFSNGKWRVSHPSGQYWVLKPDFSNIRQALCYLLQQELADLSAAITALPEA